MEKLPSKAKVGDVSKLDYFDGGGGIMMAYRQSSAPPIVPPELHEAVVEIMNLRRLKPVFMMVNRIPPHVHAGIHTDTLTVQHALERWHLPLITNPKCWYWDEVEDRKIHMATGFWHGPIPYWMRHDVGNDGDTERVHFVVDLDPAIPLPSQGRVLILDAGNHLKMSGL